MSAKSPFNKNPGSSPDSNSKKSIPLKSPSIIPDYLLKQVEEYHKKIDVSPETLKHDEHNRQESNRLRKQRQRKYKKDKEQ